MINNSEFRYESRMKKLLQEFLEVNNDQSEEELVNGVLDIVRRNYILLSKVPLHCRDCFNCHTSPNYSTMHYYCKYYQKPINHLHDECTDCSHYISGEEEARKSIAHLHYDLTGEDIQ